MTSKILIVEDEEDIRELLLAFFEGSRDYQTLSAKDGEEAIKIARKDKPDVILLDVHLPGMDGYEVCRMIKSDTTMSRSKVLMLSGMTQTTDLRKAEEVGADDYLTKPFSSVRLIQKVRGFLRGSSGV